jgi:plasmid stability protein
MKNITLKIDDETYRKARLKAAEKGTSVSAMVREILTTLAAESETDEARHQRIVATLKEIYAEADARATPRAEPLVPLTREEIYAERIR